jgi:hypothetical protein
MITPSGIQITNQKHVYLGIQMPSHRNLGPRFSTTASKADAISAVMQGWSLDRPQDIEVGSVQPLAWHLASVSFMQDGVQVMKRYSYG